MKVKGTVIVDLIRMIRNAKDRDWSKYLNPDDMEMVNTRVIATNWYNGDFFWRVATAVATEIGQLKEDNVILFGRISARSYLNVYKDALVQGDPHKSLKKFIDRWVSFYDFEDAQFKKAELTEGNGSLTITAYDYPDMPGKEMRKAYFYGLAGYYQEITEQSLEKKVSMIIDDKGNRHEITLSY